jgi:hypothetical protein
MKMLSGIAALALVLAFVPAGVPGFIGLGEQKIKALMSEENPGLILDNKVRNESFRYLKYSSGDENETWVIFLDKEGTCNGVRITYDNSRLDEKVKELDQKYKVKGKGIWTYRSKGDEISIGLKQYPWFFSITYSKTKYQSQSGNDRTVKEGTED